jgi:hypothetical protein
MYFVQNTLFAPLNICRLLMSRKRVFLFPNLLPYPPLHTHTHRAGRRNLLIASRR